MADSQPPLPESSPSVENGAAQQHRPSVSWNLTSPTASAAATKKTSGIYPASAAFQRHRLVSRPEINLGTQPQICFLRPRTSQPLVLFRCGRSGCSERLSDTGRGVEGALREPELPQTPAPSAGP